MKHHRICSTEPRLFPSRPSARTFSSALDGKTLSKPLKCSLSTLLFQSRVFHSVVHPRPAIPSLSSASSHSTCISLNAKPTITSWPCLECHPFCRRSNLPISTATARSIFPATHSRETVLMLPACPLSQSDESFQPILSPFAQFIRSCVYFLHRSNPRYGLLHSLFHTTVCARSWKTHMEYLFCLRDSGPFNHGKYLCDPCPMTHSTDISPLEQIPSSIPSPSQE